MFNNSGLSVVAYAGGFTLWHYTTYDELKDVEKTGYFDNVLTIANTGDLIIINAMEKGKPVSAIRKMDLTGSTISLGGLS